MLNSIMYYQILVFFKIKLKYVLTPLLKVPSPMKAAYLKESMFKALNIEIVNQKSNIVTVAIMTVSGNVRNFRKYVFIDKTIKNSAQFLSK